MPLGRGWPPAGGAAEAAPRTVSPLARPPGGKCGLKWAKVCTTPLAQFSRPLLRSQVKSGPDRPEGCPRGVGNNATKVTARPLKSWNGAVCPQNPAEGPKTESIRKPTESGESTLNRVESIQQTSEACAAGPLSAGTTPLCAPTRKILSEYSQNTLRILSDSESILRVF